MFELVDSIEKANCITHGAKFHADDVFSTVIMEKLVENLKLIRVLEIPEEYKNKKDIFIYDIGYGELDHHQKGGNGERENGIKYAAFGLIWKKYGHEYLEKINVKRENINLIWESLDREFVQSIDSIDNGQLEFSNIEIPVVTVSNIIGVYNPNWNEEKTFDEGFKEAFEIAKKIWNRKLNSVISKIDAKTEVELAIEKSENRIMVLDKFLPYLDFVLNSNNPKAEKLLYVVYPSNRGGYGIQAIQKKLNSFENRKPFPLSWAGLKDEQLQTVTNIKTAKFCHNARFLCTTETLSDAIEIAEKAVKFDN